MTITDWIQIILMGLLVVITGVYAWRTFAISNATKKQADASVKMAEEMREQRYDAVRPIIDIKRDTARVDVNRRILEANAASSGETVHGLSSLLRNVGLGPAIDMRSFFQHPERGRLRWEPSTLASGEKTERRDLSLKHPDNRMALVAYYKDVHDRCFESSREVSIDKEPNPNWVIGLLKIREIDKKEFPK